MRHDVAAEQHRADLARRAVPEAARDRRGRFGVGAEQAIPQRERAVVVGMDAACVVDRVVLGAMDDVGEPARRAGVEVEEQRRREAEVACDAGGERIWPVRSARRGSMARR
jgi:hypothetical protein